MFLGASVGWAVERQPVKAAAPVPLKPAAIVRELSDFIHAGMDRRLGPDYAFYRKGVKTENFPEHWIPPVKEEVKGRRYQIGGPWTNDSGDFSSTQGQILYVPDNGYGMDRVTILEWAHGGFSEKPEPPWNSGFRPEPTLPAYQKDSGVHPGTPIAMARGMGGWANCGVAIFSSGLVTTAGTDLEYHYPQPAPFFSLTARCRRR